MEAIEDYAKALIELWGHAFGSKYLLSKKSVIKHLEKHIKSYHTVVRGSKYKRTHTKSQRKRIWRCDNSQVLVILKPEVKSDDFDENERLFF